MKITVKDIERFGHTLVGCKRCRYMLDNDTAKGCTVARSDVFVTTKINPGGRGGASSAGCTQANALAQVKADVAQLNVGPLDLVLQHFPCSSTAGNQAVWKGLVQAKAQGLTRSIGVSHFTQAMLEGILSLGMGQPAVNQCQLSVGSHDDATIAFCKSKGIT